MKSQVKHIVLLALAVLLPIFIIVGCSPSSSLKLSELDDDSIMDWAHLTTEYRQYELDTLDATDIRLRISNSSEDLFSFGEEFRIEKKEGDEWFVVPFKPNTAFILRGRIVEPGSTTETVLDMQLLENTLTRGEYRVVIPAAKGIGGTFNMVAPFIIV